METKSSLPSLFVLADEYAQAAHALAQTDLDDETVRDTLEGLAGDLETKSTNVAMFVRNLEAVAEKMAEAEQNINARRKAIEKRAARVREYLKENMEKAAMTKIECPYLALTIKKNPPAVEIFTIALLPDTYMRIPPVPMPEPDKTAIKEALKAGIDVPGCKLTNTTRLEIR